MISVRPTSWLCFILLAVSCDESRVDDGGTDSGVDAGPDDADTSDAADGDGDADVDVDGDGDADADAPLACSPPDTVLVDGECVPSCGVAGGDTCTDDTTTLCDGLPLLRSHDCTLCCDRSVYPSPPSRPSFHIVHIDDVYAWDSILALVTTHDGPLVASQNRSDLVDYGHWARNVSVTWYADGAHMADEIHAMLRPVGTAPIMVMIDELRTDSIDLVAACADRMRTAYPQWAGRWGVYLVHGASVAYPNLNPAIDALLDANAAIVAEMYPAQSQYCDAAGDAGGRDLWLGQYFRGSEGSFPQGRFHWLAERRASRGSSSHLSVLFGVHDMYMDGEAPAVFLDRMFYVWVTRSGYPSVLDLAVGGGPGAWKWDQPYMSNTSRDLAFAESFDHYAVRGDRTSRLGQVQCD